MLSSNQQRGGRRQPFGFLHANILSSANAKGSVANTGDSTGDGVATTAHSSDPVKNESKKKFRGVLTSIVSRRIKGNNYGRSQRFSSSGADLVEYLAKREEDRKPNADATATTDPAADNLCHDFPASDVAGIFRQGGFWDDGMDDMLELKQANSISDECTDVEEHTDKEEKIDPSKSLAIELGENTSGELILSHNRLKHGENGFKIHIDR